MATAAILPIISGLAGLFGGGKQQQTSGSQTSSGTQNVSGGSQSQQFGQTTPNLSPIQQRLAELFSSKSIDFANQAPDLTGYTQGGIEAINNANAGSQAATRNMLAARGLAYSPAYATTATMGDQNRSNQISQFLAQIPLLQRQLQQQGISGLEQAFSTVPVGTTSTGSGSTTGNQTTTSNGQTNQVGTVSGNPLAGLFSGLGAGLGAPSSQGNIENNLGDILASLGFGGGPKPQGFSYQGPPQA